MDELKPDRESLPGDCERFLEIQELAFAMEGDPTPQDADFARRHASDCPDCAAFAAGMELMASPEPVEDSTVEAVLERARVGSPSPLLRYVVAAGIGLVAACAVFGLYVGLGGNSGAKDAIEPDTPTGMLVVKGENGGRLSAGDTLKTTDDSALFRSDPVLALALDSESILHLSEMNQDLVEMELRRGMVAAHLLRGVGLGMKVRTDRADVTVTGTVFSVERSRNTVEVSVIDGQVKVDSPLLENGSTLVDEGERLVIGEENPETETIGVKERNVLLALLGMPLEKEPACEETSVEAIASTEPAADLAADTNGSAEAAVRKGSGSRRVSETTPRGSSDLAKAAAPEATATPGDHIRTARERLKTGDWNGAASSYRRVLQEFPASPESLTVLLPLAELELEHLGRADLALKHFGTYSRRLPSGPLAEEAAHGKCLAFKALGRVNDERRALEEFLGRFPESVHARNAKARLVVLRGEKD